jgi:hypothetical protein
MFQRNILPPSSVLLTTAPCWFDPEDGGSTFLLNIGDLILYYMVLQPIKLALFIVYFFYCFFCLNAATFKLTFTFPKRKKSRARSRSQ